MSPGQINVQAPDVGTGPVPVTVTTPSGTSAARHCNALRLGLRAVLPVARKPGGGHAQLGREPGGQERHLCGSDDVAAKPGDVLILWGTGFGPTTPPVAAGIQVPSDTIHSASAVTVKIGTPTRQVFGAALAPGFAGLYQVAIQVPASMADGDYAFKATVSGASSPDGVILSVKK